MFPRDIKSLLDFLRNRGDFSSLTNNLLTQWGPQNRVMLSANFLPPRPVEKNQDTLDRVHFRTVAAVDGTRYSPSQILDAGEVYGRIHYRLGHSDLARQITGPDYDGIVRYLNTNMGMQAAARLIGLFDQLLIQAMVEHDEIANWQAIVDNKIERRGDNGYYEYEGGTDLSGHRVNASGDWTDPTFDPYLSDILPAIRTLTRIGYAREGIRIVTTDHIMQTLADNPATLRRAVSANYILTGQTLAEASSAMMVSDVERVFQKLKVQAPITHDLRIQTITGERRAYPEGNMTLIASTGQSEEVLFNVNNVADVRIVNDVLGFNGIGVANGQTASGRQSAQRAYTDQKDARVEFEAWQATGPVILQPTAIVNIGSINTEWS